MARVLDEDELIGNWILAGDELEQLSGRRGEIPDQAVAWGEFASIGMADAQPAERYFSSSAGGGSIIGNPFTEFLWGAGGLVHAWPANPGGAQYTTVQNSNVPTLLIGGTLDFATPAPGSLAAHAAHHGDAHHGSAEGPRR